MGKWNLCPRTRPRHRPGLFDSGDLMSNRGRPRKVGVERTPGGRIKRSKTEGQFLVYLLFVPSRHLFKVGSTGNLSSRLSTYQSTYGTSPIVVAELTTANGPDVRAVEAMAIASIARAGYEIVGNEWVRADIEAAPQLVATMLEACPDLVTGAGGMGIQSRERISDHDYARRLPPRHSVNQLRM